MPEEAKARLWDCNPGLPAGIEIVELARRGKSPIVGLQLSQETISQFIVTTPEEAKARLWDCNQAVLLRGHRAHDRPKRQKPDCGIATVELCELYILFAEPEEAKARLWDCNIGGVAQIVTGGVQPEEEKARLWDCNCYIFVSRGSKITARRGKSPIVGLQHLGWSYVRQLRRSPKRQKPDCGVATVL